MKNNYTCMCYLHGSQCYRTSVNNFAKRPKQVTNSRTEEVLIYGLMGGIKAFQFKQLQSSKFRLELHF